MCKESTLESLIRRFLQLSHAHSALKSLNRRELSSDKEHVNFDAMQEVIVRQLWQASENHQVCRITLKGEPFPRLVHPYGVCKTSANKIVVVCKQSAGFTKGGGGAGYRNLLLDKVTEVEILEESFQVSEDFDPKDSQYTEWVYHI